MLQRGREGSLHDLFGSVMRFGVIHQTDFVYKAKLKLKVTGSHGLNDAEIRN
jgi:hypothetical protein